MRGLQVKQRGLQEEKLGNAARFSARPGPSVLSRPVATLLVTFHPSGEFFDDSRPVRGTFSSISHFSGLSDYLCLICT